jgi:hypothetical protein
MLEAPEYKPGETAVTDAAGRPVLMRHRVALAVASMKDHMTDEGWQIMLGLKSAGYLLVGYGIEHKDIPELTDCTDVAKILQILQPSVVVLQDKREWDIRSGDFREEKARFTNVDALRDRSDIFKLTILKDAHQHPAYHRQSAEEIGCHAWIVYYNPTVVHQLAPYTRREHLIRTYHTVDRDTIPPFPENRAGCLLSGAVSVAYPWREQLVRSIRNLPGVKYLPHPGYHRSGCATPDFLKLLSQHKVAICTASLYGYALRKIIEAVACGCTVITNLPREDNLPAIDAALVRVAPEQMTIDRMAKLVAELESSYDRDKAEVYARYAKGCYHYEAQGAALSYEIDRMRSSHWRLT